MTQVIIDGIEAVLSDSFTVTVKRENCILTKNGEYTYDLTLLLDNPTNLQLYGFLNRLNKSGTVDTKRSAVLVADGRVYCRGTEVITGWTDKDVQIQIVSGNSELNHIIGDSLRIEWLDLGEIQGDVITPFSQANIGNNPTYPTVGYCLPTVFDKTSGVFYNLYLAQGKYNEGRPKLVEFTGTIERSGSYDNGTGSVSATFSYQLRPQPFLCAIVRRLLTALGYTIGINQLENTQFKKLFIVNLRNTKKYAEMLSGWSVQDFLEEVEKLCNICFVVDNVHRTVDILQKAVFYANSRAVPLRKVVDDYQLDIEESGDAEWSNSDVTYELPDTAAYRKLRLNKDLKSSAEIESNPSYPFPPEMVIGDSWKYKQKLYKDEATGRLYFMRGELTDTDFYRGNGERTIGACYMMKDAVLLDSVDYAPFYYTWQCMGHATGIKYGNVYEGLDLLADLEREDSTSEIELKLKPAPMELMPSYLYWTRYDGHDCMRPGMTNIICIDSAVSETTEEKPEETEPEETTGNEEKQTFEEFIETFDSKSESSAGDLYVAFYAGLQFHRHSYLPQAYTDAYYANNFDEFKGNPEDIFPWSVSPIEQFTATLRLQDMDAVVYADAYQIDTTRHVTFECYDHVLLSPLSVVNIKNKLWVIREIEETITAKGRNDRWKIVCHPISINASAEQLPWVLEDGTWQDGNRWSDLGLWNDEPSE